MKIWFENLLKRCGEFTHFSERPHTYHQKTDFIIYKPREKELMENCNSEKKLL